MASTHGCAYNTMVIIVKGTHKLNAKASKFSSASLADVSCASSGVAPGAEYVQKLLGCQMKEWLRGWRTGAAANARSGDSFAMRFHCQQSRVYISEHTYSYRADDDGLVLRSVLEKSRLPHLLRRFQRSRVGLDVPELGRISKNRLAMVQGDEPCQ